MSRFSSPKKPSNLPDRALPRPGDPLVLADGSLVYEEVRHKSQNKDATLKITAEPKDFRPQSKRLLNDFPSNIPMFKAIGVVFSFTMFGISNLEICDELGIDLDQLAEIKAHQGYAELFNSVFGEFINANSEMLQSRIAAYANVAANQVGHLVSNAKKEETRLAASKDVLDRAGMRPQDMKSVQEMSMNELQIRISKKTDDVVVDVKVGNTKPTRGNGENYG